MLGHTVAASDDDAILNRALTVLIDKLAREKYVSSDGYRCEETRRVVPHHLDPWVLAGSPNDPDAYELRCSRQNDYEGRLYFGKRRRDDGGGKAPERPVPYGTSSALN